MSVPSTPIRNTPWSRRASTRPWPGVTQGILVGIGVLLAVVTFIVIMTMPDLRYHPARDLELQATYTAYKETGVLLVKQNGTGSWYGQVPGEGLTRAAGDDDPGTYLVALLMSHVTGSDSPYPGLRVVMALLCALPLLILPLTVARVFRRARAGYAMLLLPPVMWLVNHGTVLTGTEYGLSDDVSEVRVYALYGMAAAMAFASLVLIAYLTTRRLGSRGLLAMSAVLVLMASAGNLMRSMSGLAVALGVGVLWWMNRRGRWRRLAAGGIAAVIAVVMSFVIPSLVDRAVEHQRAGVVQAEAGQLATSHGLWHPLYLGLSYPEPITGQPSPFGVRWSDEFGWSQARAVDPGVRIASPEYDAIMKTLYLDAIRAKPWTAVRLYAGKFFTTVKHFAAMIVVILLGLILALQRRGPHRRRIAFIGVVSLPMLVIGFLPPVLVMPMLYYYSDLSAVLGLLTALALGAIVWALSSLPSYVRALERGRLADRLAPVVEPAAPVIPETALSVVVPTRNGEDVIGGTLDVLGAHLGPDAEIIVVENGSTDDTAAVLERIAAGWTSAARLVITHSAPGLGNAYRTGVLATRGRRILLSADDLPFGFSDLDVFRRMDPEVVVAIGSKAHPASSVARSRRRSTQSAIFRLLREGLLYSAVGDSQGTVWVDGPWARMFATLSRETGLMWTVELVLAAEQQGIDVWEVPVVLAAEHEQVTSRFRLKDAVNGVGGLLHLAQQKDDYARDRWTTGSGSRTPTAV